MRRKYRLVREGVATDRERNTRDGDGCLCRLSFHGIAKLDRDIRQGKEAGYFRHDRITAADAGILHAVDGLRQVEAALLRQGDHCVRNIE